jgi:membrane protease YdiL (CAAX protease family)
MTEQILPTSLDRALVVPAAMILGFLIYGWYENSRRTSDSDRQTKLPTYLRTMFILWGLACVCLAGWMLSGRSADELGLTWTVSGWRGWVAWSAAGLGIVYFIYSFVTTSGSAEVRNQIRTQLDAAELDFMRPRTTVEHESFRFLSVTAGVTEELVFRGFLIALLGIYMPLLAAAALAVAVFGLGHIYQGWAGVVRTAAVGLVLTAVFLIGGSLLPVILLHIFIDLTAGMVFQLTDFHEQKDRANAEAIA